MSTTRRCVVWMLGAWGLAAVAAAQQPQSQPVRQSQPAATRPAATQPTTTQQATTQPATTQQGPAPKIALSQEAWDFGQVWHEERPKLNLVIRNEGSVELKISRVKPTCGCTAAEPSRYAIPPGETAELRVVYDTRGKQGKVTSEVHVHTNDPAREDAVLKIQGQVKRAITRTPLGGLVIRTLEGRAGQTGTVRLENQMAPEEMKLALRSCSLAGVSVEVKEVTPGLVYELVAKTTAEMPLGNTEGSLMVSTGLSRETSMVVPIAIRVLASVEPSPPVLLVSPDSAKLGPRIVQFQFYGSDEARITGATCANPEVKVTIDPVKPPGYMARITPAPKGLQDVRILVPAPEAMPKEGFLVTFDTTDPQTPKVDVLVTSDKDAFLAVMHGPKPRVGAKPGPSTAPAVAPEHAIDEEQ